MSYVDTMSFNKYTSTYMYEYSSELPIKLVEKYFSDEMIVIVNNSEKYGFSCFSKKKLFSFLDRLGEVYYNVTKNLSRLELELYLLHQMCNGLYEFNELELHISHEKFRSKILFPNLMYVLIRKFHKAQGFLQATVRNVYNEYKTRHVGIINKFCQSHYMDEDIIKSDILYKFLGNGLRKFDPSKLDNIHTFYRSTIRNIFYYHFKSDYHFKTTYSDFSTIDFTLSKNLNIPVRKIIYRDVLYDLQIKKICKQSSTLMQLSYNYNIFKNIIINNEFQNMFYSLNNNTFMIKNNQFKILNLYKESNSEFLNKLRDLPLIYKLLKCIHIINPKIKPYNDVQIKLDHVKIIILEELLYPFRNMFSESHVQSVLEKTASNFVDSILNGEYINPITFSTIRIKDYSFVHQLKKFVQLCLQEVGMIR